MLTSDSFLAEIEAFLGRTGMSATAFGLEVVKDPNFVTDLRSGRAPSLRLVEKVDGFIRQFPIEPTPTQPQSVSS